jgi:hypothetical protein
MVYLKSSKNRSSKKPSWLVNTSYLVPAVFVLVFAGIGVSLLLSSNAQTLCAKQTILLGQNSSCVEPMQEILNATDSHWGGMYVGTSGVLDESTETQIKQFQSSPVGYLSQFNNASASGIVNQNTWRELCYADNIWQGSVDAFDQAGCQVAFGVSWGAAYLTSPLLNP